MQNLVFQELGENFVKSNTLTNFFAFGIPFIIFPAIYVKSFHEIFATQDTSEMTIEIDPLPSRKIETFYEILTKLVSPVSRKIAEFSIFYVLQFQFTNFCSRKFTNFTKFFITRQSRKFLHRNNSLHGKSNDSGKLLLIQAWRKITNANNCIDFTEFLCSWKFINFTKFLHSTLTEYPVTSQTLTISFT